MKLLIWTTAILLVSVAKSNDDLEESQSDLCLVNINKLAYLLKGHNEQSASNDLAISKLSMSIEDIKLTLQHLINEMKTTNQKYDKQNQWIQERFIAVEKTVLGRCKYIKAKVADLPLPNSFGSELYYYGSSLVNWTDAVDSCKSYGMELAIFKSTVEMNQVAEAVPDKKTSWSYWVSATDKYHEPGQFYWSDGQKVATEYWNNEHNQPNSFSPGNEYCTELTAKFGKLWSVPCSRKYNFVCKMPAEYSDCFGL